MRLIDEVAARERFHNNLAYMGTDVKRILATQPTINPDDLRPQGRWINAYVEGAHYYRCSECGEYIEAVWTANFIFKNCPNCGACMNLSDTMSATWTERRMRMREILFRGKRVDNGEWVYGDICRHDGVVSYIGQHPADGSMVCYDIEPETVGQFTGLTDKNGKRIFEGDVVKGVDHLNPYLSVSGYVSFADASFCIVDEYFSHYRWHDYELEVIGNIHDNPELLEVSGDE